MDGLSPLIEIAVILGGFLVIWGGLRNDHKNLKDRVDAMEKEKVGRAELKNVEDAIGFHQKSHADLQKRFDTYETRIDNNFKLVFDRMEALKDLIIEKRSK